jgi:hypothetical protein
MRHPHLQKLTLTLPKSGGRSVGIVRSRTKDTEFIAICLLEDWRYLNIVLGMEIVKDIHER